jgi:ATP-dependent RNA helicase SUPV3L1/SUV3
MLICGFEKFENFFIRIEILERLFIKIIKKKKKNKIRLNSDMINLLGCSKDNFIKLLKLMNYRIEKGEKENEIHFRYMPKNTNNKKKLLKKYKKNDNLFNVLTNLNYN